MGTAVQRDLIDLLRPPDVVSAAAQPPGRGPPKTGEDDWISSFWVRGAAVAVLGLAAWGVYRWYYPATLRAQGRRQPGPLQRHGETAMQRRAPSSQRSRTATIHAPASPISESWPSHLREQVTMNPRGPSHASASLGKTSTRNPELRGEDSLRPWVDKSAASAGTLVSDRARRSLASMDPDTLPGAGRLAEEGKARTLLVGTAPPGLYPYPSWPGGAAYGMPAVAADYDCGSWVKGKAHGMPAMDEAAHTDKLFQGAVLPAEAFLQSKNRKFYVTLTRLGELRVLQGRGPQDLDSVLLFTTGPRQTAAEAAEHGAAELWVGAKLCVMRRSASGHRALWESPAAPGLLSPMGHVSLPLGQTTYLQMHDDGVLALHRAADGLVLWSTRRRPAVLAVGARLVSGDFLQSENLEYYALQAPTGRLEVYKGKHPEDSGSQRIRSTGTTGDALDGQCHSLVTETGDLHTYGLVSRGPPPVFALLYKANRGWQFGKSYRLELTNQGELQLLCTGRKTQVF